MKCAGHVVKLELGDDSMLRITVQLEARISLAPIVLSIHRDAAVDYIPGAAIVFEINPAPRS